MFACTPAQRRELILEAEIAGGAFGIEIGMREKSEHAEPVVERHHDDAASRKRRSVDRGIRGLVSLWVL
jgi:hypothetical protein